MGGGRAIVEECQSRYLEQLGELFDDACSLERTHSQRTHGLLAVAQHLLQAPAFAGIRFWGSCTTCRRGSCAAKTRRSRLRVISFVDGQGPSRQCVAACLRNCTRLCGGTAVWRQASGLWEVVALAAVAAHHGDATGPSCAVAALLPGDPQDWRKRTVASLCPTRPLRRINFPRAG